MCGGCEIACGDSEYPLPSPPRAHTHKAILTCCLPMLAREVADGEGAFLLTSSDLGKEVHGRHRHLHSSALPDALLRHVKSPSDKAPAATRWRERSLRCCRARLSLPAAELLQTRLRSAKHPISCTSLLLLRRPYACGISSTDLPSAARCQASFEWQPNLSDDFLTSICHAHHCKRRFL